MPSTARKLPGRDMDAFISHSSHDSAVAERIEGFLEKAGLKVWLDRSEIRLGVLLRKELQAAIKRSRSLVLLWSKAASKSRWVKAELLTAFHLNRFILACARDRTPLPYFLQNTLYLQIGPITGRWAKDLCRAVREAPAAANEIPISMRGQSPDLQQAIHRIAVGQLEVTDALETHDLQAATKKQRALDRITASAQQKWRLDPMVLNLVGYHLKNAYMLRHWEAIQAGLPPKDPLLARAEDYFFKALFGNPNDYEALNGLGSILMFERDYEAAEFFIRRAIALAKKDGVDYTPAKSDLAMILSHKRG